MLGMSSVISVRSHQAHIFLSLFIINTNAILNNENESSSLTTLRLDYLQENAGMTFTPAT